MHFIHFIHMSCVLLSLLSARGVICSVRRVELIRTVGDSSLRQPCSRRRFTARGVIRSMRRVELIRTVGDSSLSRSRFTARARVGGSLIHVCVCMLGKKGQTVEEYKGTYPSFYIFLKWD